MESTALRAPDCRPLRLALGQAEFHHISECFRFLGILVFFVEEHPGVGHDGIGVIAIRIDPMPAGVEEFDHMNGGWAYVDAGQLILYGHGVR